MLPQKCIAFNHWATKFVPMEIREVNGGRIHGCDVCQEVCPRKKKFLQTATKGDSFLDLLANELDLEKLLLMEDTYYEKIVHPIMYNYIKSKKVFQRNAAIALGNSQDEKHVLALTTALNTCDPMVREYAAWALGNIGGEMAKAKLEKELEHEQTDIVKEAINTALAKFQ
ncbi:HEAT repeat domain-containing protein [Serpentinicella alkaliphila]|nr:HEAT repeat domain-containing protein [Serpentinicella alkaliphila]